MSHADPSLDQPLASATVVRLVPVALATAVVALQIAYPLIEQGPARDRLTVGIVVCFAAASLTHALLWRGATFAVALFVTTALGGLAIEMIGVSTGLPFGEYRYLDSLGAQLLDVPLVVGLAWTMMAYPAYVVSEVIGGGTARLALVGGWALASWDLFLDPQMVQAGHWRWETVGPAVADIPVTNYLAWFVVAVVMMATLRAVAPAESAVADDRIPVALYLWTYASSVMAHAVFFGLPTSAVVGGIGMGVVVVALVRALR
ncbi:MAG: carotenoid biosynthesis protein [Actinobacteria bacterium]|nr:carotenoid biosynthesis protein [Actinomycetota bacterium]